MCIISILYYFIIYKYKYYILFYYIIFYTYFTVESKNAGSTAGAVGIMHLQYIYNPFPFHENENKCTEGAVKLCKILHSATVVPIICVDI